MTEQTNQKTTFSIASSFARLGTESAFEVLARANNLAAQGHDVINLGIGQPDFKTPDHIVDAACKALRDGHHGYTPAAGIPALRDAVVDELHDRIGVEVEPDCVIIVPGGKVTMFFAALLFGEPGAEIIYPDPGFPIYRSAIAFSGARPIALPLHEHLGFSFDPDEAIALLNERTRLIMLNSPANPTGGMASRKALDRLVIALAERPWITVMSDEIYGRLLIGKEQHISLLSYPELHDRLILLDGWSKTYAMTGWRLGYGVWPRALVEPITRLAINCHSCVNAATQYAGIAALQGPQDAVELMRRAFIERRDHVVATLNRIPGIRCIEPQGAFYAFPSISGTGLTSRQLEHGLLEQAHVATISGTSFGEFGEGYLRFSFANSKENIEIALRRVADWLATRNEHRIATK